MRKATSFFLWQGSLRKCAILEPCHSVVFLKKLFKMFTIIYRLVTKNSRRGAGKYGTIKKKEFFMKKHSLISLVASILLLVFAVGSLISINGEIAAIQNAPPGEGVDLSGLSIGILTIIAIFVMIYGGVALIGAILKLIQTASGAWGIAILTIAFDVILLLVNGALLVNGINEGETLGIALPALLAVTSLVAIISSGRSIALRDEV